MKVKRIYTWALLYNTTNILIWDRPGSHVRNYFVMSRYVSVPTVQNKPWHYTPENPMEFLEKDDGLA